MVIHNTCYSSFQRLIKLLTASSVHYCYIKTDINSFFYNRLWNFTIISSICHAFLFFFFIALSCKCMQSLLFSYSSPTWMNTKKHPSLMQLLFSVLCDDEIRSYLEVGALFLLLLFDGGYCLTCSSGYLYDLHNILCKILQSFMYLLPMLVLFILLLWPYVSNEKINNILPITLLTMQIWSAYPCYICLIQRPLWPHNIHLFPCTREVANCSWNCSHQNNHRPISPLRTCVLQALTRHSGWDFQYLKQKTKGWQL